MPTSICVSLFWKASKFNGTLDSIKSYVASIPKIEPSFKNGLKPTTPF